MAHFHEILYWVKHGKWQRTDNIPDEQQRLDQDVQFVFASDAGRRVLSRLLSEHYCTISHVPTGRCCDTAFNEGQRAVVHEILESLERAEKNLYGRNTNNHANGRDDDSAAGF